MNDTIYRRDAIQALVDTEEIKGFAYRMLEDRLMEIPSADKPQDPHAVTYINALENRIKELEADRPKKVIAQITFDEEKLREIVKEAVKRSDRPQGEWKYQFRDSENEEYRCSLCNYPQCYKSNYCPSCGARMFAKDINVPNKEGADKNPLVGIEPKPIPTKRHTFSYRKRADDDNN